MQFETASLAHQSAKFIRKELGLLLAESLSVNHNNVHVTFYARVSQSHDPAIKFFVRLHFMFIKIINDRQTINAFRPINFL